MNQLLGEYPCKVDAKGRVRLPSALLQQLENFGAHKFVVNRGFEKHLVLYPEKVWEEMTAEINALNQYDPKNRKFIRYFYRGATPIILGGSDRINLPNQLLEWAGISGEVVLAGVNNKIEIWPAEKYQWQINEEPDDFSDFAFSVMVPKKSNESKNDGAELSESEEK